MALPPEVARRRRSIRLLQAAFSRSQLQALHAVLKDAEEGRDEEDPLIALVNLFHDAGWSR